MSQVGQVLEQDIIRGLESIRAETYCGVAASALVFYDYASTMSREVQFMWRRPVSIVTVLFLMNRWAMLMWAVAILAGIFTSIATITGCIAISQFTNVVSVVLFALWAVFSTIRVYAISLHNLWLALIVFAVSMAPVGTNVWTYFADTTYTLASMPYLGVSCDPALKRSRELNIRLSIATRIFLAISDIIVLVTVCVKTRYTLKKDASLSHIRTPVSVALLRDGTAYFIFSLVINVTILAGWIQNSAIGLVTFPLSSIIMSHFLMNLRQVASSSQNGPDDTRASASLHDRMSIKIASYFRPLEAPLNHEPSSTDIDMVWPNCEQDTAEDMLDRRRAEPDVGSDCDRSVHAAADTVGGERQITDIEALNSPEIIEISR